jgi:LacI family repressor for deo operon, udp, cdd, tsx, nupC, and nupG
MVISQSFDSFFGSIISAAETEAHRRGYYLVCQCSYGDSEEEARIINMLLSMKVCGICVAPVASEANRRIWSQIESHLPTVYFDGYMADGSNYVMTDNFQSSRMVTQHLLSLGRIPAYLGSVHTEENLAIQARNRGYTKTMKSAGYEPILISTSNSKEKLDTYLFGYENMRAHLEHHQAPEALFCATDRTALGAMNALWEKGLTIGRDVLVAGHDDLPFCQFLNPSLTSVSQPKFSIGQEMIRSVLSLLASCAGPIKKVLEPALRVRRSTDPSK